MTPNPEHKYTAESLLQAIEHATFQPHLTVSSHDSEWILSRARELDALRVARPKPAHICGLQGYQRGFDYDHPCPACIGVEALRNAQARFNKLGYSTTEIDAALAAYDAERAASEANYPQCCPHSVKDCS